MPAQDPREIVVGPLTLYFAPAIEAKDDVDGTPSGNWVLLGTTGNENYSEAGIVITHSQTLRFTRAVGATGALKANRQTEDLTIALSLMDLSVAQYTKVLNNTTKSTDTTPNIDYIGLRRGLDVTILSMIAQGAGLSPSGAFPIQFYVPRVVQTADPALTFSKDAEAMLATVWTALEHQAAATDEERFGRFEVQTS